MFVLQQKKGTSSTAEKSPLKESPLKESPLKESTRPIPESGAKIHKGKSAPDKKVQSASSKPGN